MISCLSNALRRRHHRIVASCPQKNNLPFHVRSLTHHLTHLFSGPMATTTTANDKKLTLQKQMEALREQMEALDQEAIHELKLKLSDARKVVHNLESELAEVTGKAVEPAMRVRRERRPSITDEALQDQLLKVMAAFGKEGLNAKQLAERLHQDPLRVRKYIKDNPKILKRQGAGPGTKFFLQ